MAPDSLPKERSDSQVREIFYNRLEGKIDNKEFTRLMDTLTYDELRELDGLISRHVRKVERRRLPSL